MQKRKFGASKTEACYWINFNEKSEERQSDLGRIYWLRNPGKNQAPKDAVQPDLW